jgi:hypothetical protein
MRGSSGGARRDHQHLQVSLLATLLITLAGGLISYIIVRRETALSGLLDSVLMVPYVVPGVVMAIGFLLTFNQRRVRSGGHWRGIIVLILFIRRLPYGVRATSAVLRQIKPSIEEAAISLGASPAEGVSQGHRAIDVARCRGRRDDEFHHRHQRAVVNAAALHRCAPPPCRSRCTARCSMVSSALPRRLSTILLASSGVCVVRGAAISRNPKKVHLSDRSNPPGF